MDKNRRFLFVYYFKIRKYLGYYILVTNNFTIKKDNDNINTTYDGIFHVSNLFNTNPNHYHILTQNDLGNLSRDYKALNRLSKNKGDCYDIFKIRDELYISFLSIPQNKNSIFQIVNYLKYRDVIEQCEKTNKIRIKIR